MSPKAAMYHLTDFKIDEVSLVDHAANKRRFVILKRENPMPDEPTPEVPVSSEPVASGDTSPPAGDTHDASPQSSKPVATDSLREDITELKAMVARLAAQASEEKASSVPSQDADAVAALTERIARIEKNVGLPASAGATPVAQTAIHTWPFDINHTSKEQ